MCLYPRIMKNPRKGQLIDERQKYVTVSCGNCYECRKQKAQAWRVRLCEEMKDNKEAHFITLTFTDNSLKTLALKLKTNGENAIAEHAKRLFLERYRKKYGKSLRHWLITELGHEGTERIHIHGIIFFRNQVNFTNEELFTLWSYGRTDIGEYCNLQTINYIVKYVTKIDTIHKDYKACIWTSPGIGTRFLKSPSAKNYKYIKGESREYYVLNNGNKVSLPIYYRNKLYTDTERQKMWSDRIDKNEIWVNGIHIKNISSIEGYEEYMKIIKYQQEWNRSIGYGSTSSEWEKHEYNLNFKTLNARTYENARARTENYEQYAEQFITPLQRIQRIKELRENKEINNKEPF